MDKALQPSTLAAPSLAARLAPLVPAGLLVLAVLVLQAVSGAPLGYFDLATISASSATLALAAIGGTIVVLGGGLDLSVGAVVSLVNVVLVAWIGPMDLPPPLHAALALGVGLALGGGIGAFNGLLVGVLRLQPIIVTLASMFVASGLALLVLRYPGGEFPYDASMLAAGDTIPGLLPAPVVVILLGLLAWGWLRRTRLGVAIYAVGSDAQAAGTNGVRTARVRVWTYVLAGMFYGAAGFFVTANTGSGDPLIGAAMLLKVFAAIALGGTAIGGGRGGAAGSVAGALILTILINIFLLMGVQTYYVPVIEGLVLLLAVAGYAAGTRRNPLAILPGLFAVSRGRGRALPAESRPAGRHDILDAARFALPAWVLFAAIALATAVITGDRFSFGPYLSTVLMFSTFLAILALGQGAVILSGGLDLSIAWAITFPAIVMTTLADGSNEAAIWAIPLVLAIGALIGLANGVLSVGFGLSPIIVTLAVGSILEGAALLYSNGAPTGSAPAAITQFVRRGDGQFSPMVWLLPVFVLGAVLLLDLSAFGRRLKAVGMNEAIARLSGVRTLRVRIAAYVLSGLCAATVGVLSAGFTTQAYYDMGKPYLLGSIAVVVLGGASISGGRGTFLGMLGGALLYTALSNMLSATSLPEGLRSVAYGAVILLAVFMLRERNNS